MRPFCKMPFSRINSTGLETMIPTTLSVLKKDSDASNGMIIFKMFL